MMSAFIVGQIPLILEELARGGGGGSGGGGGGGGGGSSGGSGSGGTGSILYLIGLAGYIPMHVLGAFLRNHFFHKEGWLVARIVGWSIAGAIAFILGIFIFVTGSFLFAFYVALPIGIGALLGMSVGIKGLLPKVGQGKAMRSALALAQSKDPVAWDEKTILSYTQGIFYKYQQDWSSFNTESMKTYMTPEYSNHNNLMMYALKGAHRVNKVESPRIISSAIATVNDSDDDSKDMYEVAFMAVADDQLYDDRTNKLLFRDRSQFTEFWSFKRSGNRWLFTGIREATQNYMSTSIEISNFASQNGLYYSADWGWLLLPADGYLFSHGKFGTSDINNHVIGMVNNVLTQLYTYNPNPNRQSGFSIDQYLVVQTNVPKTYGRILVRRKSKFINWPVIGLTHVKMEWGEFNDMYEVYASDLERVTSFELLNPSFMAQLRDLPFEVNIEVVDNVVYLFTKANTDLAHYTSLYDIVLKAQKEMQL